MTPPPLTRAEVQEWYPTSDPDTHNSDHLLRQRVLALLDRCEKAEALLAEVAWDRTPGRPDVPVLQPRYDDLRAELADMRRAWAILNEPGAELRHAHTATEAAQQFVARLAEARATSKLHAEAAAKAMRERNEMLEQSGLAHDEKDAKLACALSRESALREALAALMATDPGQSPERNRAIAAAEAALASPDTAAKERDERLRAEGERRGHEQVQDRWMGTIEERWPGLPANMGIFQAIEQRVRSLALEEAADRCDELSREHATTRNARGEAEDSDNGRRAVGYRFAWYALNELRALAATRHEAKCATCGGSGRILEQSPDEPSPAPHEIAPCPSCTGPAVKP